MSESLHDRNGKPIYVTDAVRLPGGQIGIVQAIDHGFDDSVTVQTPDGSSTCREPCSLEVVDE